MNCTSLRVYFVLLFFAANFANFIKFSSACDASSDHASGVVKLLNVTVRSEATNDPGKTPSTNGLAYIEVNGKNYAPQTKGYNVAVFDALSGRFLTSAAFDCVASQEECEKLGTYLNGLPLDTIVLIAIQESAIDSGRTLPTSALQGVGAQNVGSVVASSSHAVIGYKGNKSVDWKDEVFRADNAGPAEVSGTIPISCSYMPLASSTCSPFNVASQKYGGSCLSQSSSSNDCKYAVDGNSTSGWESVPNGAVNGHIQIGFQTVFTINKLRIQQDVATGRQIQDILLEFSDCSHEKITLAANNSDFQEFTFLSRRASWVKFTVKKVYGSSGSVGIREIEIYNELCKQKTLCDAVHLGNNTGSSRYRLHRAKFPFMVDAKDEVRVLLTSESRSTSSRYEIVIGSEENTEVKIRRIKAGQSEKLMMVNVTSPLKENEMRSFWIEVEKERVLFGSGEKIYLFWRDTVPISVKYVFFSTTSSPATFHICGRIDQCYTGAAHYWPLDKSVIFVQDLNKEKIGKIHGSWTMQEAYAKLGFASLAIALGDSNSWIDLGDFPDNCISSLSKCPDGISVSFKARAAGSGTGYILSSGGVAIYYVNETMHFIVQDKDKVWEVQGSYKKYMWQTFAMSWSRENGLTAVIVGDAATVLRERSGRTVTPSAISHTSLTIGRPNGENSNYAQGAIRDVAVWEKEISEERMSSLHVCNDPDTCAAGWEYFDGSCYKVTATNLSASAARDACLSETADLVKITSEEENTFVSTLAAGEVWIGLEKNAQDGLFYWKDGMRKSYSNWRKDSSPGNDPCVVMEADGDWRTASCAFTPTKYVCEQVRYHELGCYQDSSSSPAFIFNPGGYNPESMTPGLCMHECGTWYYKYAALKNGHLCLCSNSTSPAADRASDMCSSPCVGSGNLICGGEENHISVYKSVEVRPLSLSMSLEASVLTLYTFNVTLIPSIPADHAVEFYTINIGLDASYHTTLSFVTLAILHPGMYNIRGRATVKNNHTGHRSVIDSSAMVKAVTNITGIEFICPSCAPTNVTVSCSLKFRYGSDVEAKIHFEDGKDPISGSLPDSPVITVGTPFGEGGSSVTADGLYLLAGQDIIRKGEVVALEMDLERGGALEVKVYRPKCVDPGQRYCRSQKMCISNFTLCVEGVFKNCDSDKSFSFSGGQCAAQNMSCCLNKTMNYGNFDYMGIFGFMVYATSGPKRILLDRESQRFQLEPGDVFGVRFPSSGPAAALKTSSADSSYFYFSSVINRTGSNLLRGNRLPSKEDNPSQVYHVPAIALVYSADSESRFENVYEAVGHETIILSVGNSIARVNYTNSICLQETITGLQLHLPEAFPLAETVNVTGSVDQGTNVTYIWDFGDKNNATTLTPWVIHEFYSSGEKPLNLMAANKIEVVMLWCSVDIQERIAGLRFKNDSLLAIENGTSARIGWILFNGSHVNFNITILYPDGDLQATNLTDAKALGATFFAMYKKNLTLPGWHVITITAANKVNSETIRGNLSVQRAVTGAVVDYPRIVKTNQTFNFTVLPHLGDMVRYSLQTMDGKTTNTTDKVIPYMYSKAGRYKVVLIASNDVSAQVINCAEIIVQDAIDGLQYTSFNHSVAVRALADIHWRLTQGSELYIVIDYGDGISKVVNRSLSVSDVFIAISKHNYTKPGEYHVNVHVSNLVDNQTINTTVYVETPGQDPGLAVGRGKLAIAEGGPCTEVLYVTINKSVTATATVLNGTNINVMIDFGDDSVDRRLYFHREFPDDGWTTHHSYSTVGEYNVTVVFFNRNPQNVSHTCRVVVMYPVSVVMVTSNSPKPSSGAAVMLNVSFPGYEPSGPLRYQWQLGDNTSQLVQNTTMLMHSYPNKCGVYIATVNVSNEVSYGIGIEEVTIQDEVEGLELSANYTKYENQCPDFSLPEDVFPVDFHVVFNASLAEGTNATFTWSYQVKGQRYLIHDCTGLSCRHKFNTSGNHKVQITAKNNVSTLKKEKTITLEKSILGVALTNDGPSVQKQAVNFTLEMTQLGYDSCFEIDLKSDRPEKVYYKSGTPELPCRSDTTEVALLQQFSHSYDNAKIYDVTFKAKNRVSCVVINDEYSKVVVNKGRCIPPTITAPGIGVNEYDRSKFKRSEKIIIKTVNTLDCYEIDTEFRWGIYMKCDSNQPLQLTVEKVPELKAINTSRSELIIPPRFFNYCQTIELRFMINMTKALGVFSEKKLYLEITKSPLVAVIDGGSERTVGNEDPVEINAGKSHDPDTTPAGGSIDKDCTVAWFCMREDDENYQLPKSLTNLPPIPTPHPHINNSGNTSAGSENEDLGGCFGYGPGQLNFNSTKITLDTVKMTPNSTYVIRFILAKEGREPAFADQRIKVLPGDPPTLSFECVYNCDKLNPASKFTLKGKGKSKGDQKIYYEWNIKRCKDEERNCEDVDKTKLESSSSMALTSDSLVMKPGFFEDDGFYKVILSGHVRGGVKGSSTYKVIVNKPPAYGECKVTPTIGKQLDTDFSVSCEGFQDDDWPLSYEFFYQQDLRPEGRLESLGFGMDSSRSKVSLPSGMPEYHNKLKFFVVAYDKLGASKQYEIPGRVEVKKVEFTVQQLEGKADGLEKLAAAGNIKETANLVASISLVLNVQTEEKGEEDLVKSKELRTKLVDAVLKSADLTDQTSLTDVTQMCNTVKTVTTVTTEVSEETTKKVSSFAEDASKVILKQASGEGASSETIQKASEAVFGAAVNCMLSVDTPQNDEQSSPETPESSGSSQNVTEKAIRTVNFLAEAIGKTMVPREEAKAITTKDLAMGVMKQNAENIGKEPIETGGSVVTFPDNFTDLSNVNSSVDQVSMVSGLNLYPRGEGAALVNSKLVSLAFYASEEGGSRSELSVSSLKQRISLMIPRNEKEKSPVVVQAQLHSVKYKLHTFNVTENASTVHIRLGWQVNVDVEVYVKKGSEPKPSESVFDFNKTLQCGGNNSANSLNSSEHISELFFSNHDLNWTAAGTYYALLRYKENVSLPEEEKAKMDSDGSIPYNFSVYTSMCQYYDEKQKGWSTNGTEVGPKTNLQFTECLTDHLTTFGSSFFVPPNEIKFKDLSLEKLHDSPHALITVCVILALYFICLIPARRADRNDALKTGVSPLPDNDSRDTYCYEIHVHTGFVRGAGTSAEVSIVLTGGLGDSESRVLKDPNRKNFKTGSVDPFLLTVPQSLGNLKNIRIWHNNGGNYPSWNLLRVMIQDIQTDQRWWFVCDDWLAVDESDGKIEKTLYPATKKELTKFNVLFTSEVRKNLTDGHIWFSVVARPARSTFSRVQRLTCCLSILMCTMVANAMFYRVGESETPKNAIRIMGFSFSIRQVSIGIMSSLVVFPANLIVVTIFRKAKPKEHRYSVKAEGGAVDDVDIEAGEEKKKAPKKFALPHWFVYIAYGLAFIATCTSGSFVIMYGMEFGAEKSAQWLSSMTISFIQDVLFTQPIKVFVLATLFALLIKDPKKAEQDSFTDANALANDEEWLHKNAEDLDPEMQKTLKQLINDKPPDEAKLEIARKLRMKEKQMKSIIREIIWYLIFLLVLLTISYGNRDLTTSKVTKYMQNIFEKASYSGNLTYKKVHEINHYWQWMNGTFIPSLIPPLYYNNLTPYDSGFLADTPTAWLLGSARLRQLRIKKDTCTFKRLFLHFIKECNDFYSVAEEDQGSYLPGWKVKPLIPYQNVSVNPTTTSTEIPHVKDPWEYQTGEELETYPYWGYKATYSAGGYVQVIPKGESEWSEAIGNLSVNNWLDRYTRAIFSEFAIYNANVNLFCVVTLLFEQLPTGSLTPYPSILTLRLFRYVGGEMYFVLTCEIVYLLFCAFFVFKEIRMFVKKGREHLKNPWSILEIVVTLLSLSAVSLYFTRLVFTKRALKAMEDNHGGFVSFHYTAFLDEWLKCILGIIVFLSFLKMFRLLRFNRRMSMLQQVLKRCFSQLISFMVMFALAFLAFALLACLVFGQSMEGFGTFLRSCASLMDTLLGKFTLKEMSKANRIIGPIFFYSYTVSMVFILINMFLSIINDAFTEVRSDVAKQSNDYEIVDFMIHRLKENIGKSMGHAIHPVYKEPKTELELNFDKIADNADNAMHFMRNIAFEDMRKTRWFQTETCTKKKKNLIRLLMEVDWDFYEDELCDSIPVFERFLVQHSDEELEKILEYYRQERMVEDLVFNEINGGAGSSEESDSESDESSGSNSDDDKSSTDHIDSETESVAEVDTRLLLSVSSAAPHSAKNHPGSAVAVKSPVVLVTDVEPTTAAHQQHVEDTNRKRSLVDEAASDNELLKIIDDVQRDVESRCATDAELDSILYGDTLSCDDTKSPLFESDPETTIGKKNVAKKKRKKKRGEKPKEKTTKEAWITEADDLKRKEEPEEDRERKKQKKKVNKETETKKSDMMQGDDNGDEEDVKKANAFVVTVEQEEKETKKKKKKKDTTPEENGRNQTNEDEGKKKNKKQKKSKDATTEEICVELCTEDERKKKKKKKNEEAKVDVATIEKEEHEINENEEKKKKKTKKKEAAADVVGEGEDKAKEGGEKPRKKKKNRETAGESLACEEEVHDDKEKPKKKKKTKKDELGEIFEETQELSDVGQTETKKKKKKKGRAKMQLASEEDDGQSSVKQDETEEGIENKAMISVDEESEC